MLRPHVALAMCTISALVTVGGVTGAPSAQAAGECLASDWTTLRDCVSGATGTHTAPTQVQLTADISQPGVELDMPDGRGVALDLNGKVLHLDASSTARPAITVDNGSRLEISNSSSEYAEVQAFGGANSAGIGGAEGHALGTLVINGARVIATGGTNGAGIGGGRGGGGGTVIVNSGAHSGNGGSNAAGIGGGQEGAGGSVTINGGSLSAHGSGGGAGFGGGHGGAGGSLIVASGVNAAGYGGSTGPGAGAGGGAVGTAGSLEVQAGGALTLDGGTWLGHTGGGIGNVTVAGSLHLGEASELAEPNPLGGTGGMLSLATEELVNSGNIRMNGTFTNNGLVTNTGTIQASPDIPTDAERGIVRNNGRIVGSGTIQAGGRGDTMSPRQLEVSVHNYRLAFDTSAAPGSTAPTPLRVYASTVANSQQALPALPTRTGATPLGWYTAATGGTRVTDELNLGTVITGTPKDLTLHARYLAQQTLTWTSPAPNPGRVGQPWTPSVAGGGSTAPVVVSLDPAVSDQACTVSALGVVTFTKAGTCALVANQAGDAGHEAAEPVAQTVTVDKNPVSAQVTTTPSAPVHGQQVTASVQVNAPGMVQFFVGAEPVGTLQTLVSGTASVVLPGDLAAGSHVVRAEFTPADPGTYEEASGEKTAVISQAATSTTLEVSATQLRARVSAVSPGAGTPTGTVSFTVGGQSVGTAPLHHGEAALALELSTAQQHTVGASYLGDQNFTGSSASTARKNPVLSATVAGRQGPGVWNRGPVTVRFTCQATSAPIVGECPAPVTLRAQGASQSVSRTITAADGGTTSVVVANINIDSLAPRLTVKGKRSGTPSRAPKLTCVARDNTSGIRSCTITRTTKKTRLGSTVKWTAKATDRAGNTRTKTGVYRLRSIWFEGAALKGGRFVVQAPSSHTLVVTGSKKRPVYYEAELGSRAPHRRSLAFRPAGKNRWALTITFDPAMRHHRNWNVGVKIGRKLHQVPVRIR